MPAKTLTDRFCEAVCPEPGKQVAFRDSNVQGLEFRVSGSGRKIWSLRYRDAMGRQSRLTLGVYPSVDLSAARRAARIELGRVAGGFDPASERRFAKRRVKAEPIKTFSDLKDAYFVATNSGEWRPKGKAKRQITIDGEEEILRLHVMPILGKLRLEEISRATVKDTLRRMMAKGLTTRTNRAQAVIRQIFAFGIAEERVVLNPATGFAPLSEEKPRDRTLSDDEIRGVWNGLLNPKELTVPNARNDLEGKVHISRPMAIIIQLSMLLIQRRQEISGMAVTELNLDAGTWLVPGARMKAGLPHMTPLTPKAIDLIREALDLRPQAKTKDGDLVGSNWVFPGRDPTRAVAPHSVTRATSRLFAALNINEASLHDLRRTGSTAMTSERLGVSPFIRSKVLSHRSDSGGGAAVSMVHYDANSYLAEKRRALTSWGNLLMKIVGEDSDTVSYIRLPYSNSA